MQAVPFSPGDYGANGPECRIRTSRELSGCLNIHIIRVQDNLERELSRGETRSLDRGRRVFDQRVAAVEGKSIEASSG